MSTKSNFGLEQPDAVLDRPLRLRLRPDLEIQRQWIGGQVQWVIKDPLTLEFSRLLDKEFTLLKMLDGKRSFRQIKQTFEQQYPLDRLSYRRLHALCLNLQRDGLLLSDQGASAAQFTARRGERKRRAIVSGLTNPLAIRFRGVDPEPLLRLLYRCCGWMFTPFVVLAGLVAVLAAFLMVALQFDSFVNKLPAMREMTSPGNIVLLMAALAGTKLLHELAHGLVCKHFGGQVRELGVMLLIFTPCLYCDVSDAWLVRGRWRRMAISAAGIYVEAVLAAVCLTLWWFSQPGIFNLLCLNVALVCTVGTIVFNANPLMRFDGYYILSDLLDVPNLWAQASGRMHRSLRAYVFGIPPTEDASDAAVPNWLLSGYSVASILYRWLVIAAVIWFLVHVLKLYGLEAIAYGMGGFLVVGYCAMPLVRFMQPWVNPVMRGQIRKTRFALVLTMVVIGAAGLLCWPLPYWVNATAVLRPRAADRVYITVPGFLQESRSAGDFVEPDDWLATLVNPDLERELLELRGRRDRQRAQVAALRALQTSDRAAAADIPTATEMLRDLESQVDKLQQEVEQLRIATNRAGRVMIPPPVETKSVELLELTSWQRTPLDPANRGAYLEVGTQLCTVGDPHDVYAELLVPKTKIEFLAVDQAVSIRLHRRPAERLEGRIEDISKAQRETITNVREDSGTADDDRTGLTSASETYRVRVSIAARLDEPAVGALGHARINTRPLSLASRFYKSIRRLFAIGV